LKKNDARSKLVTGLCKSLPGTRWAATRRNPRKEGKLKGLIAELAEKETEVEADGERTYGEKVTDINGASLKLIGAEALGQ